MDDEKSLWQGSPSQLINGPVFLICALAVGLLVGGSGVLVYRHTVAAPVAIRYVGDPRPGEPLPAVAAAICPECAEKKPAD